MLCLLCRCIFLQGNCNSAPVCFPHCTNSQDENRKVMKNFNDYSHINTLLVDNLVFLMLNTGAKVASSQHQLGNDINYERTFHETLCQFFSASMMIDSLHQYDARLLLSKLNVLKILRNQRY